MNDSLKFGHKASVEVIRAPKPLVPGNELKAKGHFRVEHWRDGKLIGVHELDNAITNLARQHLLDQFFATPAGAAAITAWYMGLIVYPSSGSAVPASTDTYANITSGTPSGATNNWAEFISYSSPVGAGVRPSWTTTSSTVAANVVTVTNSSGSASQFTITTPPTSGSLFGLFIAGGTGTITTAGDNAATALLWSAAAFTTPVSVLSGDVLKVTYQVTA